MTCESRTNVTSGLEVASKKKSIEAPERRRLLRLLFFLLLLRHRVVIALVKCLAAGSGSLSVLNGRSFHCWVVFVIFSLTLTICLAVFLPSGAELVAGFYLDWNRR